MRDLLARETQDGRAAETVVLYCCPVNKWIGVFEAELDGLDTLDSLVASERMRPRFAPGSTMGWDSLESNSKKSEWVKWVEFMRPQGF